MPRRVFITVGEVSGDMHAGRLIEELRSLEPDVIVEGIGGESMRAAGATIHHETVSRAAMGWQALLRAFEVRRLLNWMRRYFQKNPPDLLICIDSWAMNWHFARMAHQRHVPVLYYIAPQVWASRSGRMKRLRQYVDQVACILPFEEEYLHRHNINATFVGHPLFDELPVDRGRDPATRFPNKPPVIGLLPGSRRSVALENLPSLLDVARRIAESYPDVTFVLPTVPTTHAAVESLLQSTATKSVAARQSSDAADGDGPASENRGDEDWALEAGFSRIGRFVYGSDGFDQLVPRCDLCITVSGTATLHVAGHGVPMLVVYRTNPLLWHLVARWVIKTRTYSLVNLLNDNRQKIVPEFVPWFGSNAPVADKALEFLSTPELMDEQRERLGHLIRTLNRPGASRQAAKLALDLMGSRAATILEPPQ